MAERTPSPILLVDDHALFRMGLRLVIERSLAGAQVAECASIAGALQAAPGTPRLVLLDIELPGINGVDGIVQILRAWPGCPVLMLSGSSDPALVAASRTRGAVGYLSKAETADQMLGAIANALDGASDWVTPRYPLESLASPEPGALTARQCDVLELLNQGLSNKLIGRRLELSENTVRTHVQAILGLLGVASRSEAAFEARRRGMVR